ncbi:MAG TPA: PAS domain-containing protein, partial [Bryobacteraceae bacterium]|nr:PAS domain-containing protein [Bryobacteraceae bacterium]
MATEQSELDALRRRVAHLEKQLGSVQTNGHGPTPAKRGLRESDETYRALFDSTDQGYFLAEVTFDEAGRPTDIFYLDANPAATRMVGQDFTGRHLRDIDPRYESYWYEIFGRVARSGIGERSEQYAAPDQRWYDFFVFKLGGVGSSRVAVIFQDITQRKRADEKLRQSEERFRAFLTASSDVIYRMSADWSEMLHLQGRDFIADTEDPSRTWLEKYIHPDDHGRVTAAIQHAIHTKTPYELEHRVIRVDGTLGWTFSRAIPLLDEQGSIVEWFGAARDVTERREEQEAFTRLTAQAEQQR